MPRALDLGDEVPRRRELMDLGKRELVWMIEMSRTRIRQLEQTEERLREDIRTGRDNHARAKELLTRQIEELESDLRELGDARDAATSVLPQVVSDMITVVSHQHAPADRVRTAMAFVRVLEHVIGSRFKSIAVAELRYDEHLRDDIGYLCQVACYSPRPGTPLSSKEPA